LAKKNLCKEADVTPKPQTFNGDLVHLPEALAPLTGEQRWVVWRWEESGKNGAVRWTKPPYQTKYPRRLAKSNDPYSWGNYEDAVAAVNAGHADGIGFMLLGSDLAAIDIDHCADPQSTESDLWARTLIDEARANGAYVEITVSGGGARILTKSEGPSVHRRFSVEGREGAGIEFYRDTGRYITISGFEIGHCVELPSTDLINALLVRYEGQSNGNGATNGCGFDFNKAGTQFGDIDDIIANGVPEGGRSEAFQRVINHLAAQGYGIDEIVATLALHPHGIASKYEGRLRQEVERSFSKAQARNQTGVGGGAGSGASNSSSGASAWPEPKPIASCLLPVDLFDREFMPDAISAWVMDISDRMQCPPEFVGVTAIVALGSVIGCKIAMRPQRRTDWQVIPNLWGIAVGRPGMLKSPGMEEALKPLKYLDIKAREANNILRKDYETQAEMNKLRKDDLIKKARKNLAAGQPAPDIPADDLKPPLERRYYVEDATYEKLGVIMENNPAGIMAFRDELFGLLSYLDQEEHQTAKGFFLTAWNGASSYSFDRISRPSIYLSIVCLSLMGAVTPGRLTEYVRRVLSDGERNDGMLQRFGLLVWPDQSSTWEEVDRYPDTAYRETAWEAFERLDKLDPATIGAEAPKFDGVPFLRFDPTAQGIFKDWRRSLEIKLRSGELGTALESHLAKYRKLIPALALINHLADGGSGPISEMALLRALAFASYLETHAKRVYGAGNETETAAAKAILEHIRKGDLQDGFTIRDVHQSGWSNLTDNAQVQAGLDLLCDFGWLMAVRRPVGALGGRPSVAYHINPRARL
jgi:hypothetical protein